MRKSLIIVESMAKINTLSNILGEQYIVKSCEGSIRELPRDRFGVEVDNGFEPEYIYSNDKENRIGELITIAEQADHVYIATDPNCRGENIAWHLKEDLKHFNNHIYRIALNDLSQNTVEQMIKRPHEINREKVESQKARLVINRLESYTINPTLHKSPQNGQCVERVHLVALRLLCEREDEISAFIPEEDWRISIELQGKKTAPFFVTLLEINNKKVTLPNKFHVKAVVDDVKLQKFRVITIKRNKIFPQPSPPFTTSSLLQEASKRLGFTSSRTMMIAHQLYEGIKIGRKGSLGLITFVHTESTRVKKDALLAIRELILTDYGMEYLPKTPRTCEGEGSSKTQPEAIRPTSTKQTPKSIKKFLTPEQFKLYQLIWNRFIASQMKNAELVNFVIDIGVDEEERYLFRKEYSEVEFRGFLQVYGDFEGYPDNSFLTLSNLSKGEQLGLINILPKRYFIKPPERYDESSLLQELEMRGVGRPTTYGRIIDVLISNDFVKKEKNQLIPTDFGWTVNSILIQNFSSFLNVAFTSKLEDELDRIESGERQFLDVVSNYYQRLNSEIERQKKNEPMIQELLLTEEDEKCPQCGNKLVLKKGRLGSFFACADYPNCRFTKSMAKDTTHIIEKCEFCGKNMVVKVGRFGRFLACVGYPECKNSKPFHIGVKCPQDGCDGDIIERTSERGRLFFGCSKYPDCEFKTWQKPVGYRCSKCGNFYLEQCYSEVKGEYLRCPKCKTEYDS